MGDRDDGDARRCRSGRRRDGPGARGRFAAAAPAPRDRSFRRVIALVVIVAAVAFVPTRHRTSRAPRVARSAAGFVRAEQRALVAPVVRPTRPDHQAPALEFGRVHRGCLRTPISGGGRPSTPTTARAGRTRGPATSRDFRPTTTVRRSDPAAPRTTSAPRRARSSARSSTSRRRSPTWCSLRRALASSRPTSCSPSGPTARCGSRAASPQVTAPSGFGKGAVYTVYSRSLPVTEATLAAPPGRRSPPEVAKMYLRGRRSTPPTGCGPSPARSPQARRPPSTRCAPSSRGWVRTRSTRSTRPVSAAVSGRRRRFPLPQPARVVRADREQPRRPRPERGHSRAARHRVRAGRARRAHRALRRAGEGRARLGGDLLSRDRLAGFRPHRRRPAGWRRVVERVVAAVAPATTRSRSASPPCSSSCSLPPRPSSLGRCAAAGPGVRRGARPRCTGSSGRDARPAAAVPPRRRRGIRVGARRNAARRTTGNGRRHARRRPVLGTRAPRSRTGPRPTRC